MLLIVLTTGCALPLKKTGFVENQGLASPGSKSYLGPRPRIDVTNARQKTIIVYNHGTTRPQKSEDCDASWNRIPDSLLALQNDNLLLFFLCSEATEPGTRATVGSYIYGRLQEVEATLDELLAAGVRPQQIFLAGHSAGGWTSLMAGRFFAEKFNAAIVFAPAFAGPRSEEKRYPWWRRKARPRQVSEMLQAPEIKALVFAYHGDGYENPKDLAFLRERYPESVVIIAYRCKARKPHFIHLNDCRRAQTTSAIRRYISRMQSFNIASRQQ